MIIIYAMWLIQLTLSMVKRTQPRPALLPFRLKRAVALERNGRNEALKRTLDELEGEEETVNKTEQEEPVPNGRNFHTAAFLAKSLSDENRLRILHFVSDGKKSVGSIVEGLSLSQPLVSHHLKELKRSLLVKVERSGPFIYYELSDSRILDVVHTLSRVAADLLTARKTF
jgi:DNA-binding transcriptional ArsR family regulator